MAATASSDDDAPVTTVEALTYSFLEFSEIYANLFDGDQPELLFEMGKTLRCISKCLGKIGIDFRDETSETDDSLYQDDDPDD